MEKEFNRLELVMLKRMESNAIELLFDLWRWYFHDKYTFPQYVRVVRNQLENTFNEEMKYKIRNGE